MAVIYLTFIGDRFNNAGSWLDAMSLLHHLNAQLCINSGQEFLWERIGDTWYGIHGSSVVKFCISEPLKLESFPKSISARDIFRLDDDVSAIFEEISKDPLMKNLLELYPGLRLMRQDPEQCLFSFLCASNTNIPMIRRMLKSLCNRFGEQVWLDGHKFHTFPSAKVLDCVSEARLREAGLGYRAKMVKLAAREIVQGALDLESLKKVSYDKAREQLLHVHGVGPKIADCVLLFSLEKSEAFPIDVWITRALANHYEWLYKKKIGDKLTSRQYEDLSDEMRRYFGKHAGYAQQYLYYHLRQKAGKKW